MPYIRRYKKGEKVTAIIESKSMQCEIRQYLKTLDCYSVIADGSWTLIKPEQIAEVLLEVDNPNKMFAVETSRTELK